MFSLSLLRPLHNMIDACTCSQPYPGQKNTVARRSDGPMRDCRYRHVVNVLAIRAMLFLDFVGLFSTVRHIDLLFSQCVSYQPA